MCSRGWRVWTESYIIVVISKHIEENKGFLHNYTKLHLVHIAAFSVFGESNKTDLVLFNTLWLNKTSVVPSFRVHTVHRAPLLWRSQRQHSVTQYKPRNTSSQKRHDCWLVALDCEQSKQKKWHAQSTKMYGGGWTKVSQVWKKGPQHQVAPI